MPMSVTVARMASAKSRWSSTIRTRIGASPRPGAAARCRTPSPVATDRRPIDPPCASTIRRAMNSPKPLPPRVSSASRPRANGSKIRCRSAAGMPGPRSRTRTRARSSSASTSIVTDDPLRRVRERVADHVRDRPAQLLLVGPDHERAPAPAPPGPRRSNSIRHEATTSLDRADQVDLPHVERAGAGRPLQQRVDEFRQLLELVTGLLQQLLARRPLDRRCGRGRARRAPRRADRGARAPSRRGRGRGCRCASSPSPPHRDA